MSLITLVGNMHQFLLVALQAYFSAYANDEDLGEPVGKAMVAISLTYVIMIVLMTGYMTFGPIVAQGRVDGAVGKLFKAFGLSRPMTAPLYISPFVGAIDIAPRPVQKSDVGADDAAPAAGTELTAVLPVSGTFTKEANEQIVPATQSFAMDEEEDIQAELAQWTDQKTRKERAGRARRKDAQDTVASNAPRASAVAQTVRAAVTLGRFAAGTASSANKNKRGLGQPAGNPPKGEKKGSFRTK
jgi:hypothetical protein